MSAGTGETQQSGKPDKSAIEADIAATREDLAETVDALSAKLDVKTRAHDKAEDTKEQVRDFATDPAGRPTPLLGAAGGLAVGIVILLVLRARRRR